MRQLGAKLCLAFGSVFVFLSVLEVGTRVLWRSEVENPHVGLVLQGTDRAVVHEGIEYRTNSLGLRGKEIDAGKAKGGRRILALGDSFLWGDGLSEEDLVTTKIEKSLAADFGEVEVINGGISGNNTHDELTQLRRLAPMYQPDLVMVFFFTNDVLAEDQGGAPVSRRQNVKESLRRNSKFFAYLYYVYRDKLSARLEAPKFLLPQDYFDLDDSKRGWVLFRKSALEMRDYCSQHGAQLLFVIIPTLVNLDEQYPYAELRQATVAFLNASRIELIDLFDAFSPHRPSDLWVSPENPHWNGRGTSIAASLITDSVKQLWLAERPMSGGAAKPVQGGWENPSQLEVQESR